MRDCAGTLVNPALGVAPTPQQGKALAVSQRMAQIQPHSPGLHVTWATPGWQTPTKKEMGTGDERLAEGTEGPELAELHNASLGPATDYHSKSCSGDSSTEAPGLGDAWAEPGWIATSPGLCKGHPQSILVSPRRTSPLPETLDEPLRAPGGTAAAKKRIHHRLASYEGIPDASSGVGHSSSLRPGAAARMLQEHHSRSTSDCSEAILRAKTHPGHEERVGGTLPTGLPGGRCRGLKMNSMIDREGETASNQVIMRTSSGMYMVTNSAIGVRGDRGVKARRGRMGLDPWGLGNPHAAAVMQVEGGGPACSGLLQSHASSKPMPDSPSTSPAADLYPDESAPREGGKVPPLLALPQHTRGAGVGLRGHSRTGSLNSSTPREEALHPTDLSVIAAGSPKSPSDPLSLSQSHSGSLSRSKKSLDPWGLCSPRAASLMRGTEPGEEGVKRALDGSPVVACERYRPWDSEQAKALLKESKGEREEEERREDEQQEVGAKSQKTKGKGKGQSKGRRRSLDLRVDLSPFRGALKLPGVPSVSSVQAWGQEMDEAKEEASSETTLLHRSFLQTLASPRGVSLGHGGREKGRELHEGKGVGAHRFASPLHLKSFKLPGPSKEDKSEPDRVQEEIAATNRNAQVFVSPLRIANFKVGGANKVHMEERRRAGQYEGREREGLASPLRLPAPLRKSLKGEGKGDEGSTSNGAKAKTGNRSQHKQGRNLSPLKIELVVRRGNGPSTPKSGTPRGTKKEKFNKQGKQDLDGVTGPRKVQFNESVQVRVCKNT